MILIFLSMPEIKIDASCSPVMRFLRQHILIF